MLDAKSPGPWSAHGTDMDWNVRDRDGGLLFVTGAYFHNQPPTPAQMEADAKLAAQAPTLKAQNEELLGALKWAAISLADVCSLLSSVDDSVSTRHRNDVFQAHLKNCEAVIYRVESHNEH